MSTANERNDSVSVKYTIISPFAPLSPGDSFESEWPLHVTLLTWFDLPKGKIEYVKNALALLQSELRVIRIKGAALEQFGPDLNIPVRLLADQTELQALQDKLLHTVTAFGGTVWNHAFVGVGYRAHVTNTSSAVLNEAEEATLHSMTLIRGDIEGVRSVIASYSFEGDA